MNVLVLDGDLRCGLAVVRALGRSGIRTHVASEQSESLAAVSKYAASNNRYRCPGVSEQDFIDDIKALCQRHAITVLLPLSEITVETLIRHRDVFSGIDFPYVSAEKYELATNKYKLMCLAKTLGIPVPEFSFFENRDAVDLRNIHGYPAVVKPYKSRIKTSKGWVSTKVRYVNSQEDLQGLLFGDDVYRHPFMIQQLVSGHGKGAFYLYKNETKVANFSHRRIREKPPTGGVSVLSESVDVDAKVAGYAESLLEAIGWHGVAMVEFKEDEAGNAHLMEINPRFWGSLQLAIDAGVNFPVLLVSPDENGGRQQDYKVGVKLRWLLGDLDHLFLVLVKGKGSLKEKFLSIIRFFNFFPLSTCYETFRWEDRAPFYLELKLYLMSLFGKSGR